MRKQPWLIIVVIMSIATISAFSGKTLGTEQPSLKILAPKSTSSLPLLVLAEEDPVPGVDIQVETFINHPKALASLLKGDVHLLLTGTSQGWSNYLDGSPIVMINTGVWGVSYLMGKDVSIKTFADLKGKRIALPFPGAPLDFQTLYILAKHGIDPQKDVEISYSPFAQTVPKLVAGQVDAAPLPEPLATSMEKKGLHRLIDYKRAWAGVTDGDPLSPQVSLFATDMFTKQQQELLQEFVVHWQNAGQKVQENPGDIAKQFAEILSMPAEVIEPAIQNTLFLVPAFAENQRRVLAYYTIVKTTFPEESRSLEESFFFLP